MDLSISRNTADSRPLSQVPASSALHLQPQRAVSEGAVPAPAKAVAPVSVIIPAYRAEQTIARAIESVLAQTTPPMETIVIDDGSPDDLATVVQRYGAAVSLYRQSNQNAAAARNAGIERARGKWIAFLDADDYWEPQKLQTQLALFDRYPELVIAASRFYCTEPGGSRVLHAPAADRWYDTLHRASGRTAFWLGTMMWTGTVIVRADALAADRFQSGLEPAEDRDLWIRLVAGNSSYLASEPLATAVLEPEGISRSNIERDCTNMLRVIDRHRQLLSAPARAAWQAYVHYRWACAEDQPDRALRRLARSLVTYPGPFLGFPKMSHLGRVRRLASITREWCWHSFSCNDRRSRP